MTGDTATSVFEQAGQRTQAYVFMLSLHLEIQELQQVPSAKANDEMLNPVPWLERWLTLQNQQHTKQLAPSRGELQ